MNPRPAPPQSKLVTAMKAGLMSWHGGIDSLPQQRTSPRLEAGRTQDFVLSMPELRGRVRLMSVRYHQ